MNIDAILDPIHEREQIEGVVYTRKRLHRELDALNADFTHEERRILIRAWQSMFYKRIANILKNRRFMH